MQRLSTGRDKGFSNALILDQPGKLVFISGEVGRDETGRIVAGTFEDEVRMCFANIRGALALAGVTFADVAKIVAFMTDLTDYGTYAAVRAELFAGANPASSAVGVSSLLLGARIEIEAVAFLAA